MTEGLKLPAKPSSTKLLIEAQIAEFNNRVTEDTVVKEQLEAKQERQRQSILEKADKNRREKQSRFDKYTAFTERARIMLVEHAMYTVCHEALKKVDAKRGTSIMENHENNTALHSMIFRFIHENDGGAHVMTLLRHNGNTYYLSNLNQIIESTFKKIIASVDKNDPDTFVIEQSITDDFKSKLLSEDTDIMADAISGRIADAIGEFIEGNIKDKEIISSALQKTQEKIDSIVDDRKDDEELDEIKESYARIGKRLIMEVRHRKHGLFSEMVSVLAKEAVSNQTLRESYMNGADLNVGKIVEKATIMYGFLETVNSMKLVRITPEYIKENVLKLD